MASCASCGTEFPVATRAMHACPNCGRPVPPEAPSIVTPPPPWLIPATTSPTSGGDAGSADPSANGAPSTASPDDPDDDPNGDPGGDPGGESHGSVRPPTLPSEEFEPAVDPLAGWDAGPPPPTATTPVPDWLVVAAAGVVGLVAGVAVATRRGHGVGGAGLAGATVGALAGAATRRVWRIDAPDSSWAESVTQRPAQRFGREPFRA